MFYLQDKPFWLRLLILQSVVLFFVLVARFAYADEDAPDASPAEDATPDPTDGGNDALKPGEDPVDPEAPVFDSGIQVIPLGSLIILPPAWVTNHNLLGARWSVTVKSFLLPQPMYDTALTKAKQLDICRPALDRCTDLSLTWMRKADEAFVACSGQMDSDEELIAQFQLTISDQDKELSTVKLKLHRNRTAAGVSWAITGGILAGLVTTAVIASSLSAP